MNVRVFFFGPSMRVKIADGGRGYMGYFNKFNLKKHCEIVIRSLTRAHLCTISVVQSCLLHQQTELCTNEGICAPMVHKGGNIFLFQWFIKGWTSHHLGGSANSSRWNFFRRPSVWIFGVLQNIFFLTTSDQYFPAGPTKFIFFSGSPRSLMVAP